MSELGSGRNITSPELISSRNITKKIPSIAPGSQTKRRPSSAPSKFGQTVKKSIPSILRKNPFISTVRHLLGIKKIKKEENIKNEIIEMKLSFTDAKVDAAENTSTEASANKQTDINSCSDKKILELPNISSKAEQTTKSVIEIIYYDFIIATFDSITNIDNNDANLLNSGPPTNQKLSGIEEQTEEQPEKQTEKQTTVSDLKDDIKITYKKNILELLQCIYDNKHSSDMFILNNIETEQDLTTIDVSSNKFGISLPSLSIDMNSIETFIKQVNKNLDSNKTIISSVAFFNKNFRETTKKSIDDYLKIRDTADQITLLKKLHCILNTLLGDETKESCKQYILKGGKKKKKVN